VARVIPLLIPLLLGAAPEGPRITPYLRHQLDVAWAQDDARRERFATVRSEADLVALQGELRRKLLDLIGGLPAERTPLNARVAGTIAADGYHVEKVVFESIPGFHVTALLYVPDGAGPRPAVLLPCGHSPLGKAYANYQEIAIRLARRGYVVLCWDPVGQGERSQFWDAARGRSRYNLVCGEHAVLGNLAVLAGASLLRWEVWDGIRAVDYLLTRSEVDARRISITGTSGGGLQTAWIGALDPRIAVVIPSCYITALPMRMANRIFEDPDTDPEQDPYGLVSEGVDHAGLLLLVYPRGLFVASAVKDFVPIEGARRTFREVAAFYRRFGHGDRVGMAEGYHEHRYSLENQTEAFAFLDRLSGQPVREQSAVGGLGGPESPPSLIGAPDSLRRPVTTRPEEELRCTSSGQVRVDLPGRSLPEIIRDYFHENRSTKSVDLAALYRAAAPPALTSWEAAGTERTGDIVRDRYRLRYAGGLVMPLVHVHRAGAGRQPVSLVLSYEGTEGVTEPPPEGWASVTFDGRALGENRMRYKAASIDDPELTKLDEAAAYVSPISGVLANHAYNALLSGRPYFLELIEDAEIAARFAREQLGASRVAVSGRGPARTWAAAVARAVPGIEASPGVDPSALDWAALVEGLREDWPIHELLPDGAYIK
jgi:Acetyl xylan esterase (AXE1)